MIVKIRFKISKFFSYSSVEGYFTSESVNVLAIMQKVMKHVNEGLLMNRFIFFLIIIHNFVAEEFLIVFISTC